MCTATERSTENGKMRERLKMEFIIAKYNIQRTKRWIVSFIFNYTLHGRCLEAIDTIKYLGVYRSKDLRWNDHARNITYKANTENTEFRQVSQTKSNLNTAHQLQPRRRLLTNLLCGLQLNTADHCGTSALKPKLSHKLKWFRGEQLLELVTCYFIEF